MHASGVLAVVVAGLILSHAGRGSIRARSRVPAYAFWDLSTFMLNGSLFVLLGTQSRGSVRALDGPPLADARRRAGGGGPRRRHPAGLGLRRAIIRAVDRRRVRAAPLRLEATDRHRLGRLPRRCLPRRRPRRPCDDQRRLRSVRERDLIIFVTVTVIVLTMLIQGTTLPAVVTWARLMGDEERGRDEVLERARIRATEAGLAALPQVAAEHGASQRRSSSGSAATTRRSWTPSAPPKMTLKNGGGT